MKVYFAAPLNTREQRRRNEELCRRLELYCNVYLPQRDGGYLGDLISAGMARVDASKLVFGHDVAALRTSTVVLARFVGTVIDPGVLVEIGFAFALGKHCIALLDAWDSTDPMNPMIENSVKEFFTKEKQIVAWIRNCVSSDRPRSQRVQVPRVCTSLEALVEPKVNARAPGSQEHQRGV
jgi:nucleoside 2-deoxyribosyltransferase